MIRPGTEREGACLTVVRELLHVDDTAALYDGGKVVVDGSVRVDGNTKVIITWEILSSALGTKTEILVHVIIGVPRYAVYKEMNHREFKAESKMSDLTACTGVAGGCLICMYRLFCFLSGVHVICSRSSSSPLPLNKIDVVK